MPRNEAIHELKQQGLPLTPPPRPPRPPRPRGERNRRPLGIVAVVVVVLALLGAGAFVVLRPEESAKARAAARDPRTQEQIFNDALAAQAVLLTVADFPAEWHTEPRSPSTHDASSEKTVQSFEVCMGDPAAAMLSDGSETPGTAKSDKFVSDRGTVSAEADVTLLPSTEVAEKEYALLHRPQLVDCFGDLMNATVRHAIENPKPGDEVPAGVSFGDATASVLDLPGTHAEVVDVHVTVPVTGPRGSITEIFDFVFARKQRTMMSLFLFNVDDPFPSDLTVQLTNAMADRLPDV